MVDPERVNLLLPSNDIGLRRQRMTGWMKSECDTRGPSKPAYITGESGVWLNVVVDVTFFPAAGSLL